MFLALLLLWFSIRSVDVSRDVLRNKNSFTFLVLEVCLSCRSSITKYYNLATITLP